MLLVSGYKLEFVEFVLQIKIIVSEVKCLPINTCTGHLHYLKIKGNGVTTSSFSKFEISKLRPAKVLRHSQLFHISGLSVSPFVFHHVYSMDSDFKHIFPGLTHVKMFFNISSDKRLCLDIKSTKTNFCLRSSTQEG